MHNCFLFAYFTYSLKIILFLKIYILIFLLGGIKTYFRSKQYLVKPENFINLKAICRMLKIAW